MDTTTSPDDRMEVEVEANQGEASSFPDQGKAEGDEVSKEHARSRKRTLRACDKCSKSRTRCDGECPW